MKSFSKLLMLAFLVLLAFSCRSTPDAQDIAVEEAGATEVKTVRVYTEDDLVEKAGKGWLLAEIRTESKIIVLERESMAADGFNSDIFSLTFEPELMAGTGMPNRYTAPYTFGDNQAISVQPMISTKMASLHEYKNLSEHDYFVYLQNAVKWQILDGRLELYTTNADGIEAVLIFNQAGE